VFCYYLPSKLYKEIHSVLTKGRRKRMKKAIALTVFVIAIISIGLIGTVSASPPVYYYTLDKTSPAGTVNFGATVTVSADTDNSINKVVIEWYAPGPIAPGTLDGIPDEITSATAITFPVTATHQATALGPWTVIASFYSYSPVAANYKLEGTATARFLVSEHSIPEAPLGTIAMAIAMISAVGCMVFVKRRKA
jgi:hypothetical protein